MTTPSPEGAPKRARVQAETVRQRDAYVEETFGTEARQRFRAAASPALRQVLSGEVRPPRGWVDFELFVEAVTLLDKMFGKGDLGLVWESGRFAATHSMGVAKRLLMRHIRPSTLLGLVGGIWTQHYDGGRLVSRSSGANGLYVSIQDFPTPHRAHCLAVGGWIEASLELGPRKNTQVRELSCRMKGATSCDFQLSWDD